MMAGVNWVDIISAEMEESLEDPEENQISQTGDYASPGWVSADH